MAIRPIFLPKVGGGVGVAERAIEFVWHPGMAVSQKQKSIRELHLAAEKSGFGPSLEISTKSENELGAKLSAFNLCITTKGKGSTFTVETAFQGSKVFEGGGPYRDLIGMDSRAAKKDIRLKESGSLIEFEFFGRKFPLLPRTYFYDWIYINALHQNVELADSITQFRSFSDIEFNPDKSINCQAYSAALYVSLIGNGLIADAISSPERFLEVTTEQYERRDAGGRVQAALYLSGQ